MNVQDKFNDWINWAPDGECIFNFNTCNNNNDGLRDLEVDSSQLGRTTSASTGANELTKEVFLQNISPFQSRNNFKRKINDDTLQMKNMQNAKKRRKKSITKTKQNNGRDETVKLQNLVKKLNEELKKLNMQLNIKKRELEIVQNSNKHLSDQTHLNLLKYNAENSESQSKINELESKVSEQTEEIKELKEKIIQFWNVCELLRIEMTNLRTKCERESKDNKLKTLNNKLKVEVLEKTKYIEVLEAANRKWRLYFEQSSS